jgi:hypothetical protein
MPSVARAELQIRLKDVAELLEAHTALTGGGRGAPAERQGAAVTKAGVVLLSAATEAYVEDLFEEAAKALFAGMGEDKIESLFKNTRGRFNNASVFKTNMLFFTLVWHGSWTKLNGRNFQMRPSRGSLTG